MSTNRALTWVAAPAVPRSKSPTTRAVARLTGDKAAVACGAVFLVFVLIAVFAPLLARLEGQDPFALHQDLIDDYGLPTIGPTPEHWFGVEPRLGRDLFARFVYGARPSLVVAGLVTAGTTLLGVAIGLVAGYARGWADRALNWTIDLVLCLPAVMFALALPVVLLTVLHGGVDDVSGAAVSEVRFASMIVVLTAFGWAGLARLIRGEVRSLREREFVAAARVLGVPTRRVLAGELLPNLVAPIVIWLSMALPGYVAAEAGMTLLGVGLVDPAPSWGLTIAAATPYFRIDPLYLWVPVGAITLLVLALSLLGDAVRDAFDPRAGCAAGSRDQLVADAVHGE